MGLNPSNAIADRDHGPVFPNLAGHPHPDPICQAELEAAGIRVWQTELRRDEHPEVKTAVRGEVGNGVCSWAFSRAWYYWIARGPGLPPVYAEELHKKHGREVRVDGHCGCPSPAGWLHGFAVGRYHVDTQRGLTALAEMLKRVVQEHTPPNSSGSGD